jgi:hypothetical protein
MPLAPVDPIKGKSVEYRRTTGSMPVRPLGPSAERQAAGAVRAWPWLRSGSRDSRPLYEGATDPDRRERLSAMKVTEVEAGADVLPLREAISGVLGIIESCGVPRIWPDLTVVHGGQEGE